MMSMADEIRKLAELRDVGQITEAEFLEAKSRLLSGGAVTVSPVTPVNRLRRSVDDRWIGGVCGGLAVLTNSESWIWRLLFAVCTLFAGVGPLIYILLWIFVPPEQKN
jgi:phage shock protein C